MRDIGVVKIHCISELLSPLTHMMETAGNEALINKETINYKGSLRKVPVISGNALRHRLIREPGAEYLIDQLELKGKLTIDQANYLFYGGTLKESSLIENMKIIADLQMLFPLYRLLGGSLRNQIVSGSLIALRGVLICEENKDTINNLLPEEYKINEILKGSDDFISEYQYTRGSIEKNKICSDLVKEEIDEKQKSNLMIYNGQTIIKGSMFYHGFILDGVSRKEVGALMHAINLWQDRSGSIGGQARIGHGKLKVNIIVEDSKNFIKQEDISECIIEYINHVNENKKECVEWLEKVFPEKKKGLLDTLSRKKKENE